MPSAAETHTVFTPSPSQERAIEADPGPLLVLAGPGAGKTFCLTERIRFLIEQKGFDPARICAFTFTNKAAGEIKHRLEARLGAAAERITRGTIHAFCSALLRELGTHVLLEQGFGIADEDYQLAALRRIEGPRRWHRNTLTRFSAHRFRGDALMHDDFVLFHAYEEFLTSRKLVDFDTLVIKAAELLERPDDARVVRERYDVILVDEFQDLNPVQYRIVRALAQDHRHVFAVGDDEQSIYSWAGADPAVFRSFVNDFGVTARLHLEENRRCPTKVFALARELIQQNPSLFDDRVVPRADRSSDFPVGALTFPTDAEESAWVVDDIQRDRTEHAFGWGDVALLYRKHEIGDRLESMLLNAGIPCRLAQGRALADDPVVSYVIAAAHVIASPDDDVLADAFFKVVLSRALFDESLAKAEESEISLRQQLARTAANLPRGDDTARQIRRALADLRNLVAVGRQNPSLLALVQELLSRRVGKVTSILDDHSDGIEDPIGIPDVVALADRLRAARHANAPVWIEPMNGLDIPIRGMLLAVGVNAIRGDEPFDAETVKIRANDTPFTGIALGVFKAAQLLEMADQASTFTNFTAIDLETTDNDTSKAEIVEIAAVRVRNGVVVDDWHSLVKPRVPISHGAAATHGITEAEVAHERPFEVVWPEFRAFCGDDVIVAHNGYDFDFRILSRMSKTAGGNFDLCTFDSLPLARDLIPTSRKLVDLAAHFGVPSGQSHRALDDTRTLAHVLLALGKMKLTRARKTALVNVLDQLGVALALRKRAGDITKEEEMFLKFVPVFTFSRYSDALEWYEREHGGDENLPTADDIIAALGGRERMAKIRTEKTADERYPAAMARLRRILEEIPSGPLAEQLGVFLERVALSKWDGDQPDADRVNLLTLHSTKGLEFSRVYVIGAEDGQLPGGSLEKPPKHHELEEARRLLYVGMTRTVDRLVMTRVATRGEKPTGGHRFLDEMHLVPVAP